MALQKIYYNNELLEKIIITRTTTFNIVDGDGITENVSWTKYWQLMLMKFYLKVQPRWNIRAKKIYSFNK